MEEAPGLNIPRNLASFRLGSSLGDIGRKRPGSAVLYDLSQGNKILRDDPGVFIDESFSKCFFFFHQKHNFAG